MTIEKAIRDAEPYWQNSPPYEHRFISANQYWAVFKDANGNDYTIALDTMLMKPAFWRALGKTRGWDMPIGRMIFGDSIAVWEFNWLTLIHHLATGKDVESFFVSLL